jgi:Flp pilus assembly protein TadD
MMGLRRGYAWLSAALAILSCAPTLAKADGAAASLQAEVPGLDRQRQRKLYLDVIEGLRREGRAHAALAHLDAFDAAFPGDAGARILRADCLVAIDDLTAAETIYREQLEGRAADQAEAGLGRIEARRGRWDAAVAAFEQAVKRRPVQAAYLNDLGFALVMAGRAGDGLFRLRQAAELVPDDAKVRNNLIIALMSADRTDEADRLLEAVTDPRERKEVRAILTSHAPGPNSEGASE